MTFIASVGSLHFGRGRSSDKEVVKDTTLQPATQSEIDGTVAVLGGRRAGLGIESGGYPGKFSYPDHAAVSVIVVQSHEGAGHTGCIEQVYALYKDSLYGHSPVMDQEGRLRADYKEQAPEVQDCVKQLWDQVSNDNLYELTDFVGYKAEFLRLFGFGIEGVDYEADVDPDVKISNLIQA